ncbi:MAG: RNA polymerase sigma factor [Planctomycetota bacterium]
MQVVAVTKGKKSVGSTEFPRYGPSSNIALWISGASLPNDVQPTDAHLAERLVQGDSSALKLLMARYDRLVRFTIFKTARRMCEQDPQWLDSVASATWFGVVKSLQQLSMPPPDSIPAFLITVARNQSVSSLRQLTRKGNVTFLSSDLIAIETSESDPKETSEKLEMIERIHHYLSDVSDTDRAMLVHLHLITERKWTETAGIIGCSESTLRSRWAQLLARLRSHLGRPSGFFVAPKTPTSDRKV